MLLTGAKLNKFRPLLTAALKIHENFQKKPPSNLTKNPMFLHVIKY